MKTLFVGQNCIHLKSIDSTNSYASELLRQIKPIEGTLIYTFNQLNGRGQRGNSWECEANQNIALSIIVNPFFLHADKQFIITKIVSLAIADLMSEVLRDTKDSLKVKIKWPNDIYVGDKKIAGVLIENTLRDTNLQHSIIGIGVNINQKEFISTKKAISLQQLLKEEKELMPIVEKLCEAIEKRYLQLRTNKLAEINENYLNKLYQFEEWKNYSCNEQLFEGKILGVTETGKLEIQLRSNEIRRFDLKEIKFI